VRSYGTIPELPHVAKVRNCPAIWGVIFGQRFPIFYRGDRIADQLIPHCNADELCLGARARWVQSWPTPVAADHDVPPKRPRQSAPSSFFEDATLWCVERYAVLIAAVIEVLRIKRLELTFAPRPWPFAEARRAEIARHFDRLKQARPALWNGRILLLHNHAIEGDVFYGAYLEADYASFVAWRDWGFPDPAVRHCFALGALRARDGGFLVGVMNSHTLNAGKVYFPTGVPDPSDVADGMVDLDGSVRREVAEETGLAADAYEAEPVWYSVLTRPVIAHFKVLHARETAPALCARIRANLAREVQPELADIRIIRGPEDLDAMMPITVSTFLRYVWAR
jgi:8-oxo-dGTP pyrophosphatase MutT (NUDIX family)